MFRHWLIGLLHFIIKVIIQEGIINPSLTYAEYNFLRDLANNTVDGDKYSNGYKRLLRHRLRHKFPAVMETANMMTKVREEKKM